MVLGLAVVAAGSGVTSAVLNHDPPARKVATTPLSATAPVDTGAVTVGVAATGTVEPAVTRSLSFAVGGMVERVDVRAGSKVRAGATLAVVEDTDAATAVSDAKAALADAETRLSEAKTALAAKAVTVAGSAAQLPQVSGVDRIYTAQQQVNQARSTLAAARAALTGTVITAPMAGTVLSVAGQVGSRSGPGATFITLADTYTMRVSASFPEADAGSLATGQPAAITLADRPGQQFPATVTRVDPVGTAHGALVTYGVLLTFTAPPADLLVGQSAGVRVSTAVVARTLRVPSTAVHDAVSGTGTVVVHDAATGGDQKRKVGVGLVGDQYTQITSGLAAGEQVIRSW